MSERHSRSYQIHTGNELKLMLAGKKPMSAFYRVVGELFDETGGQPFKEHVDTGYLTKKIFYLEDKKLKRKIIYSIFTLKNEEWRIDVYRSIKKISQKFWSKDLEIIEGIILGYSIEENNEHTRMILQMKN